MKLYEVTIKKEKPNQFIVGFFVDEISFFDWARQLGDLLESHKIILLDEMSEDLYLITSDCGCCTELPSSESHDWISGDVYWFTYAMVVSRNIKDILCLKSDDFIDSVPASKKLLQSREFYGNSYYSHEDLDNLIKSHFSMDKNWEETRKFHPYSEIHHIVRDALRKYKNK